MRVNYVSRDKKKYKHFTTVWCAWDEKPSLDEDGQWDKPEHYLADFTSITKAEAAKIVGSVLKPGQIWDRRRRSIR
jgi:hypothetical protein